MKIEFKIKEIRKSNKISLKELSKRTGISKTHLNDIENNLKMPSLLICIIIAKALKKDIKDIYKIYYWYMKIIWYNYFQEKWW